MFVLYLHLSTHGSHTCVETACWMSLSWYAIISIRMESLIRFWEQPQGHAITGLVHRNNLMARIGSMPVRRQYCFYSRAFVRGFANTRHLSQRDLHYKREICFELIASLRKSEHRVLNRFMERKATFVVLAPYSD